LYRLGKEYLGSTSAHRSMRAVSYVLLDAQVTADSPAMAQLGVFIGLSSSLELSLQLVPPMGEDL
jgi:hypothetical protein